MITKIITIIPTPLYIALSEAEFGQQYFKNHVLLRNIVNAMLSLMVPT